MQKLVEYSRFGRIGTEAWELLHSREKKRRRCIVIYKLTRAISVLTEEEIRK